MPRVRTLPADVDLLAMHRLAPARWPLLLESVAGGNARWDLLFATDATGLRLDVDGITRDLQGNALAGNFLDLLDAAWHGAGPTRRAEDGLPFHGGWALYLGYELADRIEPGLHLPGLPADAVCAMATRVPAALVYDHERERCFLSFEADAADCVPEIERVVSECPAPDEDDALAAIGPATIVEQDPQAFRTAVLRAQDHISRGDIYQANLSRGWQVKFERADPLGLYESLRRANPAPFAVYATLPGMILLSSSPERLVRVGAGLIETRPIAYARAAWYAGCGSLRAPGTARQRQGARRTCHADRPGAQRPRADLHRRKRGSQ